MRKIGSGSGRRHPAGASTVVLAAALVAALAGCGSEAPPTAAPSGTPTMIEVPATPSVATAAPATSPAGGGATGSPRTVTPTGPPRQVRPGASAPVRPTGTPKRPASHDPAKHLTDLSAQTSGLRLARPVNGVRHGVLTVTVRNNGPQPVWGLTLAVEVPESVTADGGDWAGCTPLRSRQAGFPAGSECDKGYLGPGQSRVYRLGMKSPAAKDGDDSSVSRWLVDVWSAGKRGETCRDLGPDDNRRIFLVHRA